MNQSITINDMIDNLYYRTDIALSKNEMALKLIYINNINTNDRNNFYYLINAKISEESKNANLIKPIFKFIDNKFNDTVANNDYFLDFETNINSNNNNNNHYLEYKTINNSNYKINIYQTEDDKFKFNYRDWSWHISYLEPFYSTLKFKIKEERITRKIRNDFNDYVITNDNKYHKLTNDLNNFKDYIYRNDMNIKYYILILYLIIFIDFLY
jgi:hypothetical protein